MYTDTHTFTDTEMEDGETEGDEPVKIPKSNF